MDNEVEIPALSLDRATDCPFDPGPAQRARQREGPMQRVRLWDGSTPWFVTSYALQRALLAHPKSSSMITSPGYPNIAKDFGTAGLSFVLMDDPDHNRLRRTVIQPFTVKRVEAMRPRVQQIVDERIDAMLEKPRPVDLMRELALPVPSLVICELLGVPYEDHEFFQTNSTTILLREATPEQRTNAVAAMGKYLGDLLGERLADSGEDLMSGLAERIRAGEITMPEAAQIGVLMLLAGHETTANMIALGTLALLENPDQLAVLRENLDDPKLVSSAVEELLRYLSIVGGGRRRAALADIEVDGHTIRAGEGMILDIVTGNRDPDVFADPDRLDLRRETRGHLAFGFGVHQCLGQPLARLELQIAYATLFRRVPTLRLAARLEELPFKHDNFVYGVYELPVTW